MLKELRFEFDDDGKLFGTPLNEVENDSGVTVTLTERDDIVVINGRTFEVYTTTQDACAIEIGSDHDTAEVKAAVEWTQNVIDKTDSINLFNHVK